MLGVWAHYHSAVCQDNVLYVNLRISNGQVETMFFAVEKPYILFLNIRPMLGDSYIRISLGGFIRKMYTRPPHVVVRDKILHDDGSVTLVLLLLPTDDPEVVREARVVDLDKLTVFPCDAHIASDLSTRNELRAPAVIVKTSEDTYRIAIASRLKLSGRWSARLEPLADYGLSVSFCEQGEFEVGTVNEARLIEVRSPSPELRSVLEKLVGKELVYIHYIKSVHRKSGSVKRELSIIVPLELLEHVRAAVR